MAVVKGTFATNMTGRVGSVVYRYRSGQNIASQIPASVKNPQSLLQQQQRMKFNSVAQAYRCLKSLADHSFEGVTYGAPSQAKFMSDNAKLYTLTGQGHGFIAKGNGSIPMGNFKISEGSLPSLLVETDVDTGAHSNSLEARNTLFFLGSPIVGGDGHISNVSVLQLVNALGINKGDQVTLMAIGTDSIQYFGSNNSIPQCINTRLVKASFTIKVDAVDTAEAFVPEGSGYKLNPDVLSESENIDDFHITEAVDYRFEVSPSSALKNRYAFIAYSAIVSRKVGTSWLRSTQYLNRVPSTIWAERDPGTIPVYVPDFVVLTYDPKSEYYLNNEASIL